MAIAFIKRTANQAEFLTQFGPDDIELQAFDKLGMAWKKLEESLKEHEIVLGEVYVVFSSDADVNLEAYLTLDFSQEWKTDIMSYWHKFVDELNRIDYYLIKADLTIGGMDVMHFFSQHVSNVLTLKRPEEYAGHRKAYTPMLVEPNSNDTNLLIEQLGRNAWLSFESSVKLLSYKISIFNLVFEQVQKGGYNENVEYEPQTEEFSKIWSEQIAPEFEELLQTLNANNYFLKEGKIKFQ